MRRALALCLDEGTACKVKRHSIMRLDVNDDEVVWIIAMSITSVVGCSSFVITLHEKTASASFMTHNSSWGLLLI